MLILGIESSCDETAAAVVRDGRAVLSNAIASQHDLHAEYGGVVPEIASRAHAERILPIIDTALAEAGVKLDEIDAFAVGHRPGLIGSLLVGLTAAKALAWSLGKPIIGVDHLEAHLYAPLLGDEPPTDDAVFPALGLIVSGGHTAIYRLEDPLTIYRLGTTIDDAVGEAYDKVAAILGMGHPGGPAIDRLAALGDDHAHKFPISGLDKDSLDFSFSGVKTAVLYAVRGQPVRAAGRGKATFERDHTALSDREKADVAASFQRVAVAAILLKIERALGQWSGPAPKSILAGGGVTANTRLRHDLSDLARQRGIDIHLPPLTYCLDNAAMIAGLAHRRAQAGLLDDLSLTAAPTSGAMSIAKP